MHKNILKDSKWLLSALICMCTAYPSVAHARAEAMFLTVGAEGAFTFIAFIIFTLLLARVGMALFEVLFIEEETIASIEERQPYVPSFKIITSVMVAMILLFLLSLRTIGGIEPFDGPDGWIKMAIIFGILGIAGAIARVHWPHRSRQYIFAAIIGTIVTFVLIGFYRGMISGLGQDPFRMALGVMCLIVTWRFLFGPWNPRIKVVVLGTFLFWVGLHILFREAGDELVAHVLAILVALIPAVVWCVLFMGYHKQRLSMIVLMFFSGMVSTAPILFYDRIVRSGTELNFFLFKIVPQSFTRSSTVFVSDTLPSIDQLQSALLATLISFMFVALIEEFSKYWVLQKSGKNIFVSIDDALQLAIIVAIGFAFAENILNPRYFISFIHEHLIMANEPDWAAFLGNVMGRSILTNMVHIVSTGVLGYFLGLAVFAESVLEDEHKQGKPHELVTVFHRLFRLSEAQVFARQKIIIGVISAVTLHGVFNFLVTLPNLLPNNPQTIGDLFGSPPGSFLHNIAILVVPSLFYVVGGFWLLSLLFTRKVAIKNRTSSVRSATVIPMKELA